MADDARVVVEELTIRVPAGTYLFREGEPGNEMYIVQSGEIEIVAGSGEDEQRYEVLGEGDFFGEMAILEELPRTASARAATDSVLLRIDRSTFDQLIRHNPEIAIRMLRKLCHRLRRASPGSLGEGAAEPAPPVAAEDAAAVRLVHEGTGTEFEVRGKTVVTVGRFDPVTGQSPDVDLEELDARRSTSRRHATLVLRDGRWHVREEVGVANGTWVGGHRLAAGEELPLEDGARLRFGLVELVFHAG